MSKPHPIDETVRLAGEINELMQGLMEDLGIANENFEHVRGEMKVARSCARLPSNQDGQNNR